MTEELREADRETLLRVVRENDSVEFPLERKFDKKKSYALGVLSHAAYQSNEPEWLRTVAEELLGTDIVKQVYVSVDVDAEAVLFDCKDFAIVVWRGSTSVGDWLRNFDIRLTDFTVRNVEGRVHQGFINHTELGWTKIRDLLMPILEAEPDKQVVFAGHSLGGASALVSAILFERDMDDDSRTNCIITFGQPRCFDETICRHIDRTYKNSNRYWRYTHNNDIIPFIPKRPYSDAGVNMYITAGGDKIIVEPNFWFRFRDRVAGFGEDLLDGEGFADHNILLYVQATVHLVSARLRKVAVCNTDRFIRRELLTHRFMLHRFRFSVLMRITGTGSECGGALVPRSTTRRCKPVQSRTTRRKAPVIASVACDIRAEFGQAWRCKRYRNSHLAPFRTAVRMGRFIRRTRGS